ncbi:MAG: hypothetical protein ACO3N7_05425 [Kiritimatiellia bacterium]
MSTHPNNGFNFQATEVSFVHLEDLDDRDDVTYWRSQPAGMRLAALESLRQTFFGYDPDTIRFSRLLEVVEPASS